MNTNYIITTGRSFPMGTTARDGGVNFTLFSANAEKVELCLFDASGQHEIQRLELPEFTDDVWHGFVPNLPVGTLYGYRVYGPFDPHNGHRFNPHKLLLDPYAKKLAGKFIHHESHYSYDNNSRQKDLTFDVEDNAPYLPKAVITEPYPTCLTHPQVRRRNSLIYEMHVKGFTKLNTAIDEKIRGTFRALSDKSVIKYLTELGITAIELLPVHSFIDEPFVDEKGLSNFWGYNSFNFFVPQQRYLASSDVLEFRDMVETFHHAGIEVILDVVYNHTAEGNELGPTISYRGIDNASYYRLLEQDKRYYLNHSGCGNTLNIDHPRVLQLVTDSLRYWVECMGVDGFRFDLAPILGRNSSHFCNTNHFFTAIRQDPVLSQVKLIAEPWDIGPGGYQLGRFPNSWLEWNDRFRDTVRRFWRGDKGMSPEFARRLHGSADIFESRSRRPSSSVNFLTSHDGYTLHDLVTFEQRHNYANGENNQDGHGTNYSCNFGHEGETDNLSVNQKRTQQKRNLLATLFISQGTPMLLAGDEIGNSQRGNNNAYCQDNEITWLDWQHSDKELLAFVKNLSALRKAHPLLNRTNYQHGQEHSSKTGLADISWLNCHGHTMQESDWHDRDIKCFAMLLADTNQDKLSEWAHEHDDDAMLVIFNAHSRTINYQLPALDGHWQVLINTADYQQDANPITIKSSSVELSAHSLMMLSYTHSTTSTNKEKI
ncbi:glycogen debranching protein GlgX [Thalassotalea sp. M1531]|uniref:Glycogen debranching protein GlgX n=1 Tax=Thalassotalea algicola TaxID=2716224 RepID=A0A7Y0L8P3_9GAMM|nr:glycogen debranching protein GlgX [Thalassotalea algicola]NMP29998.1 glycogen debranching protein GlgX [Thalassotalea algicola]